MDDWGPHVASATYTSLTLATGKRVVVLLTQLDDGTIGLEQVKPEDAAKYLERRGICMGEGDWTLGVVR